MDKVFFFSATGNSLYVASKLAAQPLSIPQEMRKSERQYAADSIGIVSPVYYGEIPGYVQRFLKDSTFRTKYFYFVLTYGFSPAIAPQFAAEYARNCGITVNYATSILMVDNYLPYFDMDVEMGMNKHVDDQIENVIRELQGRKAAIPVPSRQEVESYEGMRVFNMENPAFNNGSQITITDKCTGCGTCTKVCPQGNCYLDSAKAHRKKATCEFCMACIHNCPVKAIGLSFEDKNPNARYRNPHITLKEIEAANCQIC